MNGKAGFDRIASALVGAVEEGELSDDLSRRTLFAADIFFQGQPPAAILRPRSVEGLARAVTACCAASVPIVPRGGGLSYSAGFVTDRDDVLLVDLRGLNAIVGVDTARSMVTVEAGCTWSELRDHLRPFGLRTRFWGPASGDGATIGGTLAQEAVLFGSGRYGTAGATLIGLTLLTADGRLLDIPGPGGSDPRNFVGDCGALGIKVRLTLPLEPLPATSAYRAVRFDATEGALAALADVGAAMLASECFLFDRWLSDLRRQAGAEEPWVEPLPGQRHRSGAGLELHAAFEAESPTELELTVERFQSLCRAHAGTPIGEGVLRRFHETPFAPPSLMLGPDGRRWLPLHFIVGADRVHELDRAIAGCILENADMIRRHEISWGWSALPIGGEHILVEPSLYWKDAQPEQVTVWFDAATLAARPTFPANADARAAVADLRTALITAGRRADARHIQLGRLYPANAAFAQWTLPRLQALKRTLDPRGLMNPGALGLS